MTTEHNSPELQAAAIIVRPDLTVLVQVQDQSIELHLDPLQALGLGKRLVELGLAFTEGFGQPETAATTIREATCQTH